MSALQGIRNAESEYKVHPNDIMMMFSANEVVKNLSKKERDVLKLIQEKPEITKAELCEKTKFSHATIDRALKKLKEQKVVERIGSDKKGSWKVIKW